MGYFQQELEHWVIEKKNPPSPKKGKLIEQSRSNLIMGGGQQRSLKMSLGGGLNKLNKQTKKFEDESGTNNKITLLWSFCQQKLDFWVQNYYSHEVKHKKTFPSLPSSKKEN